jgi:hypothetical protein
MSIGSLEYCIQDLYDILWVFCFLESGFYSFSSTLWSKIFDFCSHIRYTGLTNIHRGAILTGEFFYARSSTLYSDGSDFMSQVFILFFFVLLSIETIPFPYLSGRKFFEDIWYNRWMYVRHEVEYLHDLIHHPSYSPIRVIYSTCTELGIEFFERLETEIYSLLGYSNIAQCEEYESGSFLEIGLIRPPCGRRSVVRTDEFHTFTDTNLYISHLIICHIAYLSATRGILHILPLMDIFSLAWHLSRCDSKSYHMFAEFISLSEIAITESSIKRLGIYHYTIHMCSCDFCMPAMKCLFYISDFVAFI